MPLRFVLAPLYLAAFLLHTVVSTTSAADSTLQFSGYTWQVRRPGKGGPGPNVWSPENVWVDQKGYLHLKLAHRNGVWTCAELTTQKRLGFGRYQFTLIGRVDRLDQNVVFGIFPYPTAEIGPDMTHEIDIEFSRWSRAHLPIGNYSVWPAKPGVKYTTHPFAFTLNGDRTTHRFTWTPDSVFFQSLHGHRDDDSHEYANWLFQPKDPAIAIGRKPMPLHINLWCHKGNPPSDGQEVEVIVREFKFTPAATP